MDKKNQKQTQVDDEYTEEKTQPSEIKSEHTEDYQLFFRGKKIPSIDEFVDDFLKSNIMYNENCFLEEARMTILEKSANSKIVKLIVQFSYFTFTLHILNEEGSSPTRKSEYCPEPFRQGFFGKICRIQDGDRGFNVIKNVKYMDKDKMWKKAGLTTTPKYIRLTILEYCFYKLFSILRIGPKVYDIFGFNLIIYDDSIEFAIEECKEISPQDVYRFHEIEKSLMMMHNLQIVHCDIKPENLMYSPTYEKLVFIDFNLSKIIKQKRGLKTQTAYAGTPGYMGLEMRQLYQKNTVGFVDMFYNDVQSLEIVKKSTIPLPNTWNYPLNTKSFKYFYDNVFLQFLIYCRRKSQIEDYLQKNSANIDNINEEELGKILMSINFNDVQKQNIFDSLKKIPLSQTFKQHFSFIFKVKKMDKNSTKEFKEPENESENALQKKKQRILKSLKQNISFQISKSSKLQFQSRLKSEKIYCQTHIGYDELILEMLFNISLTPLNKKDNMIIEFLGRTETLKEKVIALKKYLSNPYTSNEQKEIALTNFCEHLNFQLDDKLKNTTEMLQEKLLFLKNKTRDQEDFFELFAPQAGLFTLYCHSQYEELNFKESQIIQKLKSLKIPSIHLEQFQQIYEIYCEVKLHYLQKRTIPNIELFKNKIFQNESFRHQQCLPSIKLLGLNLLSYFYKTIVKNFDEYQKVEEEKNQIISMLDPESRFNLYEYTLLENLLQHKSLYYECEKLENILQIFDRKPFLKIQFYFLYLWTSLIIALKKEKSEVILIYEKLLHEFTSDLQRKKKICFHLDAYLSLFHPKSFEQIRVYNTQILLKILPSLSLTPKDLKYLNKMLANKWCRKQIKSYINNILENWDDTEEMNVFYWKSMIYSAQSEEKIQKIGLGLIQKYPQITNHQSFELYYHQTKKRAFFWNNGLRYLANQLKKPEKLCKKITDFPDTEKFFSFIEDKNKNLSFMLSIDYQVYHILEMYFRSKEPLRALAFIISLCPAVSEKNQRVMELYYYYSLLFIRPHMAQYLSCLREVIRMLEVIKEEKYSYLIVFINQIFLTIIKRKGDSEKFKPSVNRLYKLFCYGFRKLSVSIRNKLAIMRHGAFLKLEQMGLLEFTHKSEKQRCRTQLYNFRTPEQIPSLSNFRCVRQSMDTTVQSGKVYNIFLSKMKRYLNIKKNKLYQDEKNQDGLQQKGKNCSNDKLKVSPDLNFTIDPIMSKTHLIEKAIVLIHEEQNEF